METLRSRLTTGEPSGGQEHCQQESPHRGLRSKSPPQTRQQKPTNPPKPHGAQQPPKPSRRQQPERKRLRQQRQSTDSDSVPEDKSEAKNETKATTVPSASPEVDNLEDGPTQSKADSQESTPKQKRERKPQRPGKYVCNYCGRACAKPSVLQKHIRSHTGERPYPCAPCGFSFKTKSNLYKHRKSHTHRVKAGLALGEPRNVEEQVTESEDETRQLTSASSLAERQSSVASMKSHDMERDKDCTTGSDDSYAVKKRLALRLSRGKQGLQTSSEEKSSSLILASKGSTESGYFSRSESTEQAQDSPPNTSAKSYAEIILGKYGRLGHLQRMSRHYNQQSSDQKEKSIPFTVPKKQVIDHITKLITINEAVVDTSKIDSVKPRRFSLSRKNSSESQKTSSVKDPLIHSPKAAELGYKNKGSITMGVPCEKFQHQPLNVEQPPGQTANAPLVRSHSMPSTATSFDASNSGPGKFRQTQSFDEQQPSEIRPRRYGMLRRQPAIEIPLGAEPTKDEHKGSHLFYPDSVTTVPDLKQSQPQPYECEACGTGCHDWDGYKKHKQSLCSAQHPKNEVVISQSEFSQLINHAVRAGASAVRKRRKEESFEFDDPTSPSVPSSPLLAGQCKEDGSVAYEVSRRPTLQTCSVIQHTSSFEKHESLSSENQGPEATKNSPPHEECQQETQKQPPEPSTRKLARQPNVQVPEILVTEDSTMTTETSVEPGTKAKPSEKPDEFQWPQRSSSLAQLPIEKLPPKKKRLRLAEVAQSSGESSFDSISLPRSPSQESSASYASSRSTSFEESNRPDMETVTSSPLRRSRASHMLTVPGVHQHREMRRSASEQAPHDPQSSVLMAETRSKSFDYSCLSPERTAVGWRERRKCLLMRHNAVRDPDEEEEDQCNIPSPSPERATASTSSSVNPTSVYCARPPCSPASGDTLLRYPVTQWTPGQSVQLAGCPGLSNAHCPSIDTLKADINAGQPLPQAPHLYSTHGPSGAARARYLPMSTGLKLEIPTRHDDYSATQSSLSLSQHSVPHITSSVEILRPLPSPSVAVRLQADTLSTTCAIYTTMSQATSPRPQVAVNAISHSVVIPAAEYRNHSDTSLDVQSWYDEDLRLSGSGGSKRMLSPSNSIEILPESQQQQKRVKEEGEARDKASVDPCGQDLKQGSLPCPPGVCSPVSHVGASFPSLLSGTCNSWCYLNYIKPNPSALDEQKPSVYSSWSTSNYNPNPPGLSSKTALSLLHCKQRLSPSIYTISTMSVTTTESGEQEDNKRMSSTEVHNRQPCCRDQEKIRNELHRSDGDTRTDREAKEEYEKRQEVEVQSHSRTKEPPEVWISEKESNEKCGRARGGGRCQCEECRLPLRNASAPHTWAESPPWNCSDCHIGSKAKGSLSESLRSEPGVKETCTTQGSCKVRPLHLEEQKDLQRSDLSAGERGEDRAKYRDESEEARGGPMEPEAPDAKDSAPRSSAKSRRALFARRRLDASSSVSSRGSRSPGAPSPPPRSPSPGPPSPPAALPSPRRHVSVTPLRPASPVRGLSPVMAPPLGSSSCGPPGALADTSALHQTSQPPWERLSTARLSVDEVGPAHVAPPPQRLRANHNLLSHLPLHSQLAGRAPSLLIPIGGIHMIQPRSALPLYSLVTGPASANPAPTAAAATAPAPWRQSAAVTGRFSLLHRQDSLREVWPEGGAGPVEETSRSGRLDSHRKSQGLVQSRTEAGPAEADERVAEACVRPQADARGQKKTPASQTRV